MIDAVLLFTGQWIVVAVLSRQLQALGLTSQEPCSVDVVQLCEGPNRLLGALLTIVVIASTLGYHAFFEGRFGATPGKYWMGLRVADLGGAMPIGLTRAMTRSLVRQAFWIALFVVLTVSPLGVSLPAILFLALPLLAFGAVAIAAFTADTRGAHDHIAGTKVVRIRPLTADDESADALFEGPLWSDPNQPEDLPEHLASQETDPTGDADEDQADVDNDLGEPDLHEHSELDREESL